MVGSAPQRSAIAQSALVAAITLAALLALCAVLAYWTWVWFAPRTVTRVPAPPQAQARVDAAYTAFGGQRSTGAPAPTALAIKLLGVVAASGSATGYAVVQLEANRILAVKEGNDVAPGIRLAQVEKGQVVLERNGVRETLALPEKK